MLCCEMHTKDGKDTGVTVFGKYNLPSSWTGNFVGNCLIKAAELWDDSVRESSFVSFFPWEVIRSESEQKKDIEGDRASDS